MRMPNRSERATELRLLATIILFSAIAAAASICGLVINLYRAVTGE